MDMQSLVVFFVLTSSNTYCRDDTGQSVVIADRCKYASFRCLPYRFCAPYAYVPTTAGPAELVGSRTHHFGMVGIKQGAWFMYKSWLCWIEPADHVCGIYGTQFSLGHISKLFLLLPAAA
jgi:hypothetical protein